MKDRLILLVGASGSGKTTIAKELEEGYNIIQSYTTREPREPNEWGHTFIDKFWIDSNAVNVLTDITNDISFYKKDMIAYFNSYDKGHHYFATKEQYQGKGTSIYIIDPGGSEQVRQNVRDAEVITIFLMTEEDVRFVRMMGRTGLESKLDSSLEELKEWQGIKDRLSKDREIFSKCKCDYVVDANRDINLVVLDILEIIEQEE